MGKGRIAGGAGGRGEESGHRAKEWHGDRQARPRAQNCIPHRREGRPHQGLPAPHPSPLFCCNAGHADHTVHLDSPAVVGCCLQGMPSFMRAMWGGQASSQPKGLTKEELNSLKDMMMVFLPVASIARSVHVSTHSLPPPARCRDACPALPCPAPSRDRSSSSPLSRHLSSSIQSIAVLSHPPGAHHSSCGPLHPHIFFVFDRAGCM